MRDKQTKKGRTPLYLTLGLFGMTLGLMLTAVILQHRGTSSLFANNIVVITLFNVNLIILVVLFLLLSRNLIKFYFEGRRHRPGSRFQTKLILSFVGFSLIPTVLLAVVASGLLNRSIDGWFNSQMEHSLSRSLDVAQMYYQKTRENSLVLAKDFSRSLSDKGKERGTDAAFSPAVVQQAVRPGIQIFQVSGLEVFNPEGDRVYRYLRSGLSTKYFPWIGKDILAQKG
ncbi:MAG: hypothetical protein HZA19_00720, partial [Nitrospirae bacterium]|nr:hypothetical protein [Nitrospirota bacterium]